MPSKQGWHHKPDKQRKQRRQSVHDKQSMVTIMVMLRTITLVVWEIIAV